MLERLSDSQVREIFVHNLKTAKKSCMSPLGDWDTLSSFERMKECEDELKRREEFRRLNP